MKASEMVVGEAYYSPMHGRAHVYGGLPEGKWVAMWVDMPATCTAKGLDRYGVPRAGGRHVRLKVPGQSLAEVLVNAAEVEGPWIMQSNGRHKEAVACRVVVDLEAAIHEARNQLAKWRTAGTRDCMKGLGLPQSDRFDKLAYDFGEGVTMYAEEPATHRILLTLGFIEDDEDLVASLAEAEASKIKALRDLRDVRLANKVEARA